MRNAGMLLSHHTRQRWSVRLAEAASGAAAMGKPWKDLLSLKTDPVLFSLFRTPQAHHPPLPWYAVELMRVCTGTMHLSSQLMALQAGYGN